MAEDRVDDVGVDDEGDDPHLGATGRADEGVDFVYPLDQGRPAAAQRLRIKI